MKQRELRTQLKSDKSFEENQDTNVDAIPRVSPHDTLRPNYTVLVDTNFMLSSIDIFRLILSSNNWSVVIPNTVMTELLGLGSSPTVGDAAHGAVETIQACITAKKDPRIIGNNVTNIKMGFYKEKLQDDS